MVTKTAGEAAGTLSGLRSAVRATGAGILGSGSHPAAPEGSMGITDKDRYERIRHLLGDAVADPTGGLHGWVKDSMLTGGTVSRIQGTPDLLPSDITGFSVYERSTGEYRFGRGPVVANIVLLTR